MQEINKEEWIDTITISPILAKQVLRKFLKSQSARQYTQILDEYFISQADEYDGMPEIKIVLEDWLDSIAHQPDEIRKYIDLYFKFMSKEKQHYIMNSFIESMHTTEHTQTIFMMEFLAPTFIEASKTASSHLSGFDEFLSPIDEFKLIGMTIITILGSKDEFRIIIKIENHHSITKEHITALVLDMQENSLIGSDWKVNEDEDKL